MFGAIAAEYGWRGIDIESEHLHDPIPPGELSGSVGTYVSDSGLRVELSNGHGGMVLAVAGRPPVRLVATSATELAAQALYVVVCLDADSRTLKQAGGSVTCVRA